MSAFVPPPDPRVIGLRPPLRLSTDKPCASCKAPILPGQLYTPGPPVRHVSCPAKRR